MTGAILFTADLLREVDNAIRLDCIRTTSYGSATESHGTPKLVHGLTLDVADRHVLIVDDILDTGKTLSLIAGMVRGMNPASLRVCVLLDKKGRRQVPFEADLVGFEAQEGRRGRLRRRARTTAVGDQNAVHPAGMRPHGLSDAERVQHPEGRPGDRGRSPVER
eukprot:gene14782-biopygen13114